MTATVAKQEPLDPRRLRQLRVAVTVVFLAHGLLFASWTAHIPHVKAHLGLSDATLGVALLGAPVGSVTATLVASYSLPRFGSKRVTQVALIGYCAAGPFVGLTGNLLGLFVALFAWGAFQGTLDVSMNTQAIAVERRSQRPLMSGLHGSWSIGAFAGAGIGVLAVGIGLSLSLQLLILGTVALLAAGWLTTLMLPDAVEQPGDTTDCGPTTQQSRWAGGMILLGFIVFAGMLCEGATGDWASVYLSDSLKTKAALAGLGYATFALAMVIVRLSGNWLLSQFRPDRVIAALAALATIGITSALLIGHLAAALVGFACLGAGLGSVVPAVFSAAGRIPGLHPGTAVATASACGWTGFVCGPPIIGQLASWTSLPVALGLIPVLTTFITIGTLCTPGLRVPHGPESIDAPIDTLSVA